MRPIGIWLAAALIAGALIPAGAWAAPKAVAGVAKEISKDDRAKGMAAAPALIAAAGADCQLADARQVGQSVDPKSKEKSTLYEVACTGNEGLVIEQVGVTNAPLTFTCEQAGQPREDGKPSNTVCLLPGNLDPMAGFKPYIAKVGVACTPDKMRALGQSPTNAVFEVVCREQNGGYILETSVPPRLDKPISMNPCIGFSETGNIKCILTDRTAQMAVVDKLVAQLGKPCAIKDRGFVGVATSTGKSYYEVACQDGKGYMIETLVSGAYSQAIDCASADVIGGGCKLTDARQAKTEQAGLYTKLAKRAGFDCAVSGYAPLPGSASAPGDEVVELACSNRADGGIGFFAPSASQPSMVYDCAHSELVGYRCSLSKAAAAYPKLTAELKTLGKASCTVSNARVVGLTADKKGYVEVACSDGLQGYMIEYNLTPLTPTTTIVCSDAKGIAGGCTLPGNSKKA